MGYYTQHNLEVKNISYNEFIMLRNMLEEKNIIGYALDHGDYNDKSETAYFYCEESCKWYESDKDMTEISLMLPLAKFKLMCDGEESDDFHYDYFINGKSETCIGRLIYEEPTILEWGERNGF